MVEWNASLEALCLPQNKAKRKEEFIYEMREALSRKMSVNIWGEGSVFESDDENIDKEYKKLSILNRFDNTFPYIERQCSLYGRVIAMINKTKTNDYNITLSQPFWISGVGKSFMTPQLCVIYQKVTVSQLNYVIKSEYTTSYVKHEVYMSEADKIVRVLDKEAEVLEMFQLERYWKHDLGFVPVVEFTNIPFVQREWMDIDFIRISDWYPGQKFEELAYTIFRNFDKELKYCHSRIFFEEATQQIVSQFKQSGVLDDLEDANDIIFDTGNGKVMFQPGIADLSKYTNALDHVYDFYYKLAGSSRFSEGGGAQKTVAETSSIRSAMIENVKQKIRLRTEQCKELIKKLLCCVGAIKDYWDTKDNFNFKIVGNITRDDSSWIDNKIKLINQGVISTIDFIQELFNISTEEAKKKFEEVKKWNEENGMVNIFSDLNPEEPDNESNFNKETGEHSLPDKKGLQ